METIRHELDTIESQAAGTASALEAEHSLTIARDGLSQQLSPYEAIKRNIQNRIARETGSC